MAKSSKDATPRAALTFTKTLPQARHGVPYTGSVVATNGVAPVAYTVSSGALPPGMQINAASGAITGTPTQISDGAVSFSVYAADSTEDTAQTGTASCDITVTTNALAVAYEPLGGGAVGEAYTAAVSINGGQAPYTITASEALPDGLTMTPEGAVRGTPTAAGSTALTFEVEDSQNPPMRGSVAATITITRGGGVIDDGTIHIHDERSIGMQPDDYDPGDIDTIHIHDEASIGHVEDNGPLDPDVLHVHDERMLEGFAVKKGEKDQAMPAESVDERAPS